MKRMKDEASEGFGHELEVLHQTYLHFLRFLF